MEKEVVIKYFSASKREIKDRPIADYNTIYKYGKFYVEAFCLVANDRRTFSYENILDVTADGKPVDKYSFFIASEKNLQKIISDILHSNTNLALSGVFVPIFY